MSLLLNGTAFGTLLHLASGGNLLKTEAQRRDPLSLNQDIENSKDREELIVTWYGADDPECPYNWPTWYKCWVTLLLYIMTLSVYMGSSVVSPAITDISEDFKVSQVTAALSMSLFVWGYGFGPLLLSPITEISWVGRNGPYIFGLGLFTILQIPTALVTNIGGLLTLRFLAGFFGSPVLATGAASIGDIWRLDGGFMNALAFWNWGASGGPTVGPLLVSFAVSKLGWRWSIWPLLCLNGLNWLLLFFALPETSSSAILTRRANTIRKQTGNSQYRSAAEIKDGELDVKTLFYETLCRPVQLTVTEPVLLCSNLYIAYVYGIVYCFFEAYPIALQERHGFSLGVLGVAYVSGFVGSGVAFGLYCIYNTKLALPRFRQGRWTPEYRMEPAFVGGLLLPISLFWFGWTSFEKVHWISCSIAFSASIMSIYLLLQGFWGYLGENFPRHLASVYASNGLFRALVGGAFPLFATQMFEGLTLQGGCSLLGGMALLLLPTTLIFYVFGPKLRSMSKNAGQGSREEDEGEIDKTRELEGERD